MKLELMLDSGAFSAHSQGTPIILEDYANYILDDHGMWDVVASLDVIPRTLDPKHIARAADQGWENWVELKRLLKPVGIEPIHTFHFGEPIWVLERLKNECEYFALGGFAKKKLEDKAAWLDSIMPLLVDDEGWPTHRLHGFGATSVEIMDRFPFASVDSTSWIATGRFGAAFLTGNLMGRKITFSEKSRVKNKPWHYYTSLSPSDRKAVDEFLLTQTYAGIDGDPTLPMNKRILWFPGMTPRMLAECYCLTCNKPVSEDGRSKFESAVRPTCCAQPVMNIDYVQRDALNIRYFLEYERNREIRPWNPRRPGQAAG